MIGTYVGIDLSLTSTGVAVITGGGIRLHRITSKGAARDTLAARRDRLNRILSGVAQAVPPNSLVAIEGPSYGQRHQAGVHDRSWLWGKVVDYLADRDYRTPVDRVPVIEVPPSVRAKYAAGRGNASKDMVLAAACRRYLDVDITGNDVADALILAAIVARMSGEPIEASLPAVNLTALDKLTAPAGAR